MEETPKTFLEGAAGEQMPNAVIKQEMEWLAEYSHVADLANHEVGLDMESMKSIKTEEDPYHTDEVAYVVYEFTPAPQTAELIKAELILDEEFSDKLSGSEENCKQLIQPLADRKQEFSCDLCERTFSKKSSFNSHKKVHYNEHPTGFKASTFICEVCGSSVSSGRNLREHMLRKHLNIAQSSSQGPRTADDATNTHTEGFFEEDTASLGQESAQAGTSKSDTKSEACELCHCVFPTEYIRIHKRLAHSKPKHKCEVCSRVFKQKCRLESHRSTHAATRKRNFVCDICERGFYEKGALDKHMKRYPQKDHPKFNCEACLFSCTRKGDLDVHMLATHLEKSQPMTSAPLTADHNSINAIQISANRTEEMKFECGVCSRTFSHKSNFKRHLSTHDEHRQPDFPCDLCERAFFKKSSLTRHKTLHSKEDSTGFKASTFSCEECGSDFSSRANLMMHMLRMHLGRVQSDTSGPQTAEDSIDTKTEKFLDEKTASYGQASAESAALPSKSEACEICHCIFPTEYMRMHMRFAHSKTKYKCKICSRSFRTEGILMKHLKAHDKDGKAEFSCDSCDSAFYSKSDLWGHKEKVHNMKTFPCKVCGRRFTRMESLNMHRVRRLHFDETQQFRPRPSNDADVPMKTELHSDEEEEFIDEGKEGDTVAHAGGSQQPTLAADDEPVCQQSYPGELIDTHMRMTHDDRTHKCQFCPQMFLHKSELKSHIRSHADKGKHNRLYACELCGKFLFKESLKRHIATQHTEHRKPLFCEFCEKRFYSQKGLKDHVRTHADDAISCGVCGARFTHEEGLKYHMLHKHATITQQDPPTGNYDSVHTKEELTSDEKFLDYMSLQP